MTNINLYFTVISLSNSENRIFLFWKFFFVLLNDTRFSVWLLNYHTSANPHLISTFSCPLWLSQPYCFISHYSSCIGTAHESDLSFLLSVALGLWPLPDCQLFYQDGCSGIMMNCYLTLSLSDYTKIQTLLTSQHKIWPVSLKAVWCVIHSLMEDDCCYAVYYEEQMHC